MGVDGLNSSGTVGQDGRHLSGEPHASATIRAKARELVTLETDSEIAIVQVNVTARAAIDRVAFLLAACERRPTWKTVER